MSPVAEISLGTTRLHILRVPGVLYSEASRIQMHGSITPLPARLHAIVLN
jgi:hypothetical protein